MFSAWVQVSGIAIDPSIERAWILIPSEMGWDHLVRQRSFNVPSCCLLRFVGEWGALGLTAITAVRNCVRKHRTLRSLNLRKELQ